jgi:chaperonin cofactor prefoldin
MNARHRLHNARHLTYHPQLIVCSYYQAVNLSVSFLENALEAEKDFFREQEEELKLLESHITKALEDLPSAETMFSEDKVKHWVRTDSLIDNKSAQVHMHTVRHDSFALRLKGIREHVNASGQSGAQGNLEARCESLSGQLSTLRAGAEELKSAWETVKASLPEARVSYRSPLTYNRTGLTNPAVAHL